MAYNNTKSLLETLGSFRDSPQRNDETMATSTSHRVDGEQSDIENEGLHGFQRISRLIQKCMAASATRFFTFRNFGIANLASKCRKFSVGIGLVAWGSAPAN